MDDIYEIAFNHSIFIDFMNIIFKDFMNLYEKCTANP